MIIKKVVKKEKTTLWNSPEDVGNFNKNYYHAIFLVTTWYLFNIPLYTSKKLIKDTL